jgi:hypothetical protein
MSRYFAELATTALMVSQHIRGPRPPSLELLDDADLPAAQAPLQHLHRERDFGVGYGNSSGYATDRHYVADYWPQRFRCL